jgi:hypothetical protein
MRNRGQRVSGTCPGGPHKIRFRIPPEIVSLILRIREERRYGAVRVSLYLQRHYHAYVSPTTILKTFHRHHVGPVSQKKYRPGPKPPDAPLQVPGRSVQLDVKFVPRVGRARQRFYQFTAIDEATRFRVLRIYDHDNTKDCYRLPTGSPRAFPLRHSEDSNRQWVVLRTTVHLASFRSQHLPQTHTSGLPGGQRLSGAIKPIRRSSTREGISNIKGSGSKAEEMGNRIQRRSASSRAQGQDAS